MKLLSSAFIVFFFYFQPLRANAQENITIPTDFFSGIVLDSVITGPFLSYKPIRVSGTVSDPQVSLVQFEVLKNDAEEVALCPVVNWYYVTTIDGKFGFTFFFSHEQAGDHLLEIRTRREGWPLSSAGVFRPFVIRKNTKTSPIPVDFFPDIELTSAIPVEITTGQSIRVSGTVADPSLTMVGLQFMGRDSEVGLYFDAPVIAGQFNKSLFFAHKTAGVYRFGLVRHKGITKIYRTGDLFEPINVKKGEGTAFLPSDYFEEIDLTSAMPVVYTPGQKVRVTGTVSDPSIHQIRFLFVVPTAVRTRRTTVGFTAPVTNGEFSVNIGFSPKQQPF